MTTTVTARCDRHVDAVHSHPCAACDALTAEWQALTLTTGPSPASPLTCPRGHIIVGTSGGGVPFCAFGCPTHRQ